MVHRMSLGRPQDGAGLISCSAITTMRLHGEILARYWFHLGSWVCTCSWRADALGQERKDVPLHAMTKGLMWGKYVPHHQRPWVVPRVHSSCISLTCMFIAGEYCNCVVQCCSCLFSICWAHEPRRTHRCRKHGSGFMVPIQCALSSFAFDRCT